MAGRTMRRFARRKLGDSSRSVSRGLMAACERFCTGETSGVRSALGDSERSSRMIRKSDRRGAGGGERESRDAWSSSTRWPEHAREGGLVVRGAVAEHRLFIARRWFSESRQSAMSVEGAEKCGASTKVREKEATESQRETPFPSPRVFLAQSRDFIHAKYPRWPTGPPALGSTQLPGVRLGIDPPSTALSLRAPIPREADGAAEEGNGALR